MSGHLPLSLWDLSDDKEIRELPTPRGAYPQGVAVSANGANGKYGAVSIGQDIRIYDLATGTEGAHLANAHNGRVWALAFPRDGRFLLSGGEDGTVRLWHRDAGNTDSMP